MELLSALILLLVFIVLLVLLIAMYIFMRAYTNGAAMLFSRLNEIENILTRKK